MRELIIFAVTHLLLPGLTLAMTIAAVMIGRARRRNVGRRLTPPAIEPARPGTRQRRGRVKKAAMLRYPGSSARRQRQVVEKNRVGR